ncbi:MAG: serine hydrolase [Bacteroidota bacterium]
MYKYLIILVLLSISSLISCAQEEATNYEGEWIGHLPDRNSFNFTIQLEKLRADTYRLLISNGNSLVDRKLKSLSKDKIQFNIDDQLSMNFLPNKKGDEISGFIQSGRFYFHLQLKEEKTHVFKGKWNPFMVDGGLNSDDIMLYMEYMEDSQLVAYPIFGDQRFRGTWAEAFQLKGNTLYYRDGNTGFNFKSELSKESVSLEIYLLDALITKTQLTHANDWEYSLDPVANDQTTARPESMNDGWNTASIKDYGIEEAELLKMIEKANDGTYVNTHSILIAKEGKLVFENYFEGFNANIPHDLRSASKSISSAVIGIAIDDQIIKGVDEKLYDFIPQKYQYTKDERKADISLQDLLTMSSGLDVNNQASEGNYQDPRNTDNWLKTVLEAPMVNKAGSYADYGSANPFLLGVCLSESLEEPVEMYMHRKLFAPLGISNYINQSDDTKQRPYFGGGMLITPRDLLKFGQLFLNKGTWKGKRIVSESWVKESTQKHAQLQDVSDKNEYGYQWWHDSYEVQGKAIDAIEARGAGGQFIFILPELESVVVITSGNFRNRKGNQPRDILKDHILPALVE